MSAPRYQTGHGADDRPAVEEFPSSSLQYAFNPWEGEFPADVEFDPNELVVYEPQAAATGGRWASASRGSFVGLDERR
jgi:hypothetical protein